MQSEWVPNRLVCKPFHAYSNVLSSSIKWHVSPDQRNKRDFTGQLKIFRNETNGIRDIQKLAPQFSTVYVSYLHEGGFTITTVERTIVDHSRMLLLVIYFKNSFDFEYRMKVMRRLLHLPCRDINYYRSPFPLTKAMFF